MLNVGYTYTLAKIYQEDLTDIPNLSVIVNGEDCPIQQSHMTVKDFLDNPDWAQSEWVYLLTTNEEIPCFAALNSDKVLNLVDVSESIYGGYWVVPKSHPREEY